MPGFPGGLPGLMAGYLLKTSVVLIAALLAAAAAKKRPAAFRHFILTSALTALLLLPLLTLAPAGWRSPLVPAWMGVPESRPADAPKRAVVDLSAGVSENSGRGPGVPQARQRFVLTPVPAGSPRLSAEAPRSLRPGPVTTGSPDRAAAIGLLLALLWAAGLAVLLLRLAFGLSGAARWTAEGKPLDDASWRVLVERFLAFVSLRREVRLKSHPEVLVPLTWGFRRPVVLFPDGAGDWTEDERSSALYHELSHIKRADFLAMLLVRAGLALFWWNPLCWIVYREILKEQEIACDELVLRAGIRPSIYAASLLAFRRSAGLRWNPSAALLGMLGKSSFQERLAAILKQKLTSMEVKMKTKITLALALIAVVALVGTARPAVGIGKSAAAASLVAAAAPAAATQEAVQASPVSPAVQAAQATAQEKQKEQEKAKAAEKAKEAEKAAKDKAMKAKTIVIKQVGEEGEPLRLEIKGGGIEVMREGKPLTVGEGGVYRIVEKAEAGEAAPEVIVKRIKELKPGENWVAVEPGQGGRKVKIVKRGEAGTAWTIEEPEKGEAVWVSGEVAGKEMLEKVQALQEQVQAIKAKKMDLSALEESLKKLEAELKAKEDKLKTFSYEFDKEPGQYVFSKRSGDEAKSYSWVMEDSKAVKDAKGAKAIIGIGEKEGEISLLFTGYDGEAGKAAFERAIVQLKKDLPEGYKLAEQKYDAESGVMTFKIASPEGQKIDKALVRKLIDGLKAEIDKK